MAKLNIIDIKNSAAGEFTIPAEIEKAKAANQAIFDQVVAETAGKRQGTHSTLTKAEVRGGGKKPVPQKHTGNARQGSIRNPHYVGGGVVFGPKPNRNYRLKINKKVSTLAMIAALNAKIKANQIVLLKDGIAKATTKDFANLIKLLKAKNTRVLFVFNNEEKKNVKFAQNINKVDAKLANQVSVLDLLKAKKVIFQAKGFEACTKKLLGGNK